MSAKDIQLWLFYQCHRPFLDRLAHNVEYKSMFAYNAVKATVIVAFGCDRHRGCVLDVCFRNNKPTISLLRQIVVLVQWSSRVLK